MAAVEQSQWWYPQTRALLRQVFRPWLVAGGRFLDAGGGTGATGAWMAEIGRLDVVDVSPLALTLLGDTHPEIARCCGDLSRLPFRSGSYDGVLCVTVLCHEAIDDPVGAVRELARVVRPGGIVCLLEPGVRRLRRGHDRVTHTARRFSRRDLEGLLSESGCEVVWSSGAYAFLVPLAAVKALLERGRMTSDLDRAQSGLAGVLPLLARLERRLLRRVRLPFGLSVVAIGTVIAPVPPDAPR
jgi:SAM-dependent methyltransferase